MIEILTWVSIIAGGILILLVLLSLVGGLDLDLDMPGSDVDVDAGGLGVVKGLLTFVTTSSWVLKVLLATGKHPGFAIGIAIFCGLVAFFLLNLMLVALMKNNANVNWSINDAHSQKGTVYLKIPATDGTGIVQVKIKGAMRELKAKSFNKKEIETGSNVMVVEVDEEYVVVLKETE